MTSYTSIGAYKIALMTRSARTILVEGDTDVAVIKRLILERDLVAEFAGGRPVIDGVGFVKDDVLSGLGNRCRVLAIAQEIPDSIKSFMAFVDREWSDYDFQANSNTQFLDNYSSDRNVWITKGHSIENYFFDPNYYRDYFLRNFGDKLLPGFFDRVPDVLEQALNLAFAFSAAAREAELIERCSGIISRTALLLSADGKISLNVEAIERLLAARQVTQEKLTVFKQECVRVLSMTTAEIFDRPVARWLAHGHLGDSVVWACFALVAVGFGVDEESVDQIQSGRRREKLADGAHFIAQREDCEKAPLEDLISWAFKK